MLASTSGRVILRNTGGNVRVVRMTVGRRASTETSSTTPPPKKSHFFRRVIVLTSLSGIVFYGGSTVAAFNSDRYHDFFVESAPLGETIVDYAEHHGWDIVLRKSFLKNAVDAGANTTERIGGAISRTFGTSPPPPTIPPPPPPPKDTKKNHDDHEPKKVKEIRNLLHTRVEKIPVKEEPLIAKITQLSKAPALKFSEDVDVLVKQAEAALRGTPHTEALQQLVGKTSPITPDGTPSSTFTEPALPSSSVSSATQGNSDKKVYTNALPLGFEPPPGFVRPAPPSPASPASESDKEDPKKELSPPPAPPVAPLPLVAPAVSELSSTEPIIAQLASSIDTLTSYLNDKPTVAPAAKEIIQTAQTDLVQLGVRLQKVKDEERKKLEQKLDEQAREYTTKLLELELDAQDKIDAQEEGWKTLFEGERQKVVQTYREKLEAELKAQTEIINQRLKEEVIAQGIELQRRWIREIKVRVEQERGGRLARLDSLATNLKKLERVTLDNSTYLDENLRLHALWSAFRALHHASLDAPTQRPFREELRVLRHLPGAKEDPLVQAALDTLEKSDVPDVGVTPLPDLTSWFSNSVTPRVTIVALVPDQNAGLLSHVASSLLSNFRFKRQGLVDGNDVSSRLTRAEYYLSEKDLDAAAREVNQLSGWAKVLCRDWLEAARRRLEVQQALEIVEAQATLASLLVV